MVVNKIFDSIRETMIDEISRMMTVTRDMSVMNSVERYAFLERMEGAITTMTYCGLMSVHELIAIGDVLEYLSWEGNCWYGKLEDIFTIPIHNEKPPVCELVSRIEQFIRRELQHGPDTEYRLDGALDLCNNLGLLSYEFQKEYFMTGMEE